MSYIGLSRLGYLGNLGSKIPGDSPRSEETVLREELQEIDKGIVIPPGILKTRVTEDATEPKPEPKPAPKPEPKPVPSIDKDLPYHFGKCRKLTAKEIAYAKEILGNSVRYDKVRISRDHWFSYPRQTRVTGNTINFSSHYGGEPLFEDTETWQLNKAGLDLLGHEIIHVWQYQNGGWAYAGDALTKQAAGAYSTGSRNTAYDWQTALEWELPWEKWGPEQQAQAIDDWNLAKRKREVGSSYSSTSGKELVEKLQPYVDKARKGQGATEFSVPGTIVCCLVASGIGYLVKKHPGLQAGLAIGLLINLPWNKWFLRKKK
jgi:hypothetical protein